jgi:hypothetical protein
VRLAALCSEKAVTFHEQCGPGWLVLGRIYFQPQISAEAADKSKPTPEAQRHREKTQLQILY